jgi:hypothetical protein
MQPPAHPAGHFYSPIVDTDELTARADALWPAQPVVLGVDFDDESHRALLDGALARFLPEYDYAERDPRADADLDVFYTQNSQFSWLDSRALFAFLREWRPARVIEVGSGYSSLLMADVNRRFLDGTCDIRCIEPYPRPFLAKGLPGITEVLQQKVQDVPLAYFDTLQAGDILFIDSSHVSKTGSDVNYLYFEILPRLRAGVRIHVHDIFLPHEYPRDWVLGHNRSWNEQYLLRALLMYSNAFRIVFGCNYAFSRFPDRVREVLAHPKGHAFGGGSIWIERLASPQAPPT